LDTFVRGRINKYYCIAQEFRNLKHSNKITAQQLVQSLVNNAVEKVVISPGSRNAPLIIELNAYDSIEKYSIVDERSAAFFALGIAQQTQKPVALVCSSGSALLNYYPAITEAFYSDIPLIAISADRPKHLIDIGDGQTIRQENVFQNHIHFSANLDENSTVKNTAILNKAFEQLQKFSGPIHINMPFAEPLYEVSDKLSIDDGDLKLKDEPTSLLTEEPLSVSELEEYAGIWNSTARKMVLLGVHQPDEMIQTQLNHIVKDSSVIVLTETTSNVYNSNFVACIDKVIFPFSNEDFKKLQPEVLLTFGGMVVSKKIKELLRANQPKHHWHIDSRKAMNTYHCLTHHFQVSASLFFSQFFFLTKPKQSTYQKHWIEKARNRESRHTEFVRLAPFSDFAIFDIVRSYIPKKVNIQFSNSATIRYAQLFHWSKTHRIFCNRGTSGIDGSNATAIGAAVANDNMTLLITGDLSFFYDSNALWNKYIPSDFRIVLINNGGGGIFRFIPGPTSTNTLDFFETSHKLTAGQLCDMYHIDYKTAYDKVSLEKNLVDFFKNSNKPKLLEVFTPREENALVLKNYFNFISQNR